MQIKRDIIETNLQKKGFVQENTHHRYFHHEYQGKRTGVSTYTSHGSEYKDYGDGLISLMKKQLQLDTNRQAHDLFVCTMNEDEYNEILKEKGII